MLTDQRQIVILYKAFILSSSPCSLMIILSFIITVEICYLLFFSGYFISGVCRTLNNGLHSVIEFYVGT